MNLRWTKWDTRGIVGAVVGAVMMLIGEDESSTEKAGKGVLWLSLFCDGWTVAYFRLLRVKFKRKFIWRDS